ncbi:white-brown complex 30 [Chlorella sorokiniana]|uniref:White-brown complex 30 n=1 Tax=Chlorella sorokiniana TaxID=3076 RepID=A0A2P6U0X1_CHLSO|nr:white-brown complex 30 [Chlorella sorokiniana]|eukprot:PRW59962.1 white-brown complex 30 [Chlorella sorokiniana]
MRLKTACCVLALLAAVGGAAAASAGECPDPLRAATVPEGCPCNPVRNATFGACDSGYVCAQPWALQVAQAKARSLLATLSGSTAGLFAPPEAAVEAMAPQAGAGFECTACSYGQLCPRGSSLPPVLDPAIQIAIDELACPAGFYCPTPASKLRCPAGYFCPPSTIQPVTCNMSMLVDRAPLLKVPDKPLTVVQRVFILGDPLQGNTCPLNSSSPAVLCPEGFYCPEPAKELPCPAGYFCKAGSLQPQPCPFLTSCPEGSASANLSYSGFLILVCCMVVMWLVYAMMRAAIAINQKRLARQQEAQDRLWRVLHPLLAPGAGQSFRAFKAIRPRLTLEFEGLGLELPDGRSILHDVTGRFEHSRLAAVMGPSGAGKTTFLAVLRGAAGNVGRQHGRVLVNGREMRLSALRDVTGFVPQEASAIGMDVVHEDLTVRENLVYSARLRLSAGKPLREQLALVEDCIDLLQLRHVQHQVVGMVEKRGISGGQRKRVNIGIELAAKPAIMWMDEPTSGLDATAAADILPRYSIFRLFDDVLLLGKGGRMVYLGPSRLALPYFETIGFTLPPNENPADFAMDVIAGSVPRSDGAPFQPADLVTLWTSHGRSWVQLHSKLAAKAEEEETAGVEASRQRGVDPEQVALLEDQFDAQDEDGDGALDAVGLQRLLEGLGLEPTNRSVAALVQELAVPRTGLVTREAFVQYVVSGGRTTPATAGGADTIPAAHRRADTLYRVYSIEQYTLAGALSEVAASALTPGLRAGTTLKDLAVAHHNQQQQAAAVRNSDQQRQQAKAEEQQRRVSSGGTPSALHLPSPFAGQPADAATPGSSFVQHSASQPVPVPVLVDVQAAATESSGLLAWLGLQGGSELRATPGAAAQFGLLLIRAGVKLTRNWSDKMMQVMMIVLAAVVCGVMHGSDGDEWTARGHIAMVFLSLGVLSGATALSVFGFSARLTWWREQERGVKPHSYFLASTVVNLFDVAVLPLVFLAIYSSMTLPTVPFVQLYGVGVLVVWYCTSLGTLMSVLAPPSSSLMATAALLLIAGGMLNGVSPNYRDMAPALRGLTSISYNRWAVELVTVLSFSQYPQWRWPSTKAVMATAGYCGLDAVKFDLDSPADALAGTDQAQLLDISIYCANSVPNAVLILLGLGCILRLLTALALAYVPRGLRLQPVLQGVAHMCGMALFSPVGTGRPGDGLSLLSPSAGFAALSPLALFASPRPALKEGRLSFDVLLAEHDGPPAGTASVLEAMGAPQLKATRSASHIDLFALPEPAKPGMELAAAPVSPSAEQQQQQLAALKEAVQAKVVAAKQQEAAQLVAGIASKYGLAADYGKAEQTIKAVWAEQGGASRANSAAPKPASQQTAAEELTLAGKGSSAHASADEEAGPQATSTLKAPAANGHKRPMEALPTQHGFSFQATAAPGAVGGMDAGASGEEAAKKRRVQYDRMRALEAEVQRLRLVGDMLGQSLRSAQASLTAVNGENEQLWNAMMHIHASLRAAHAAHLRQQVAIHAAAVAAALPPPQPVVEEVVAPSPATLFGGLFSPDADELAAACGMFISPAKTAGAAAAANKPRKLFAEEAARPLPAGKLADLPADLHQPGRSALLPPAILGPLCDGQHSSHDVLHYVAPSHLSLGAFELETCWWVPAMFALAGIIIGLGTPLLDAWQLDQGGDAPRGGTDPSWPFVFTAIALFVLQYAASGALEQPLLDVTLPGGLPALDCLLAATGVALWAAFDGTRQGLFMAALTAVCGPAVEITLINVFHLYAYTHTQWLGVPLWIPWVYFAGSPAVGNLARRVSSTLLSRQR